MRGYLEAPEVARATHQLLCPCGPGPARLTAVGSYLLAVARLDATRGRTTAGQERSKATAIRDAERLGEWDWGSDGPR